MQEFYRRVGRERREKQNKTFHHGGIVILSGVCDARKRGARGVEGFLQTGRFVTDSRHSYYNAWASWECLVTLVELQTDAGSFDSAASSRLGAKMLLRSG